MGPLPSRRWRDLRWTDFAALPAATIAILPVAAIEQHGPHLPVSTDTAINEALVDRALARLPAELPVLVLPTQAIGSSAEHLRFPGTLTAEPETLIALWTQIGESVARAGIRRLVLFNSHGGQPQLLDIVARRLRARCRMLAVACTWFRLGLPDGVVDAAEARHGIHAGQVETAAMLALAPHLVDMAQARDFASAWLARAAGCTVLEPEGITGFGWETQDLHPAGAVGDATRATPADGDRILDHAAARLAALLAELHGFDLDTWLRDAPAAD
ncbi:creatininase family protein [Paracraurococcus ruber]|uniref:Creatininase n=1 Tax=Paracraurococcus ruber TaxID=77675 RepID=A0ABS1D649_9PROT|nr:creatininase family protein [Paracraurococcus ruber]MBK1661956.1 creatininase [Paracraurococcus ruber]TDG16614.1 creatininase family protein [Paracraurococcus ruber]